MTPQSVGIRHSTLVLGKHSGRHALRQRYEELGYALSATELERVYEDFCAVADRKKEVYDEELIAILEDRAFATEEDYALQSLQVSTGTGVRPTATVELRQGEKHSVDSATGDGPVDAAYRAIERLTGVIGKLTEYSLTSVSLGHDTLGEAFVRVEFDGVQFNGRAADTDIVTGSVQAYLGALNRALAARRARAARSSSTPNTVVAGAEA
jgi:2-isopropylmalate synthase